MIASDDMSSAVLFAALRGRPTVAVLDTSCVRTGLGQQVNNERKPASLTTAQDGTIRLFMEKATLEETLEKLPLFADQLKVPPNDLRRMFATDWLPNLRVVDLPPELRQLDSRAAAVRDLDPDDYPAACLAALLSPCILLTHNHKDFRPLGIEDPQQGVNAVLEAINMKVADQEFQAHATITVAPVMGIGAGIRWAIERKSPVVWGAAAVLVLAGVITFQQQPPDRKKTITDSAIRFGRFVLTESERTSSSAMRARQLLGAYVVPPPEEDAPLATVLSAVAGSREPMSAQRLYEELEGVERLAVTDLRAFLHQNKDAVFQEVRRGTFVLGQTYVVAD